MLLTVDKPYLNCLLEQEIAALFAIEDHFDHTISLAIGGSSFGPGLPDRIFDAIAAE